jgi:beta-galactosidase
MKKTLFLFIVAIANLNSFAQTKPDWENPAVFAVNKENTRSNALPYATERDALNNEYKNSPYYKSLNGNWQFYWVPKIADVPANFYAENYKAIPTVPAWKKGEPNHINGPSNWTTIPVPGNWEFHGFGIPMYVNIGFGMPRNPPYIDRNDSPTGAYRHEFEIPKNWDGRRVYLHFEAGTNSMYVWINGKKVGYTENSKSPAEFDITPYIRQGKNLLACEVHKFSDGTYLEDQDMWRLAGINRSVYLYSTAQTRIQDFFSHADLDANYKDGLFGNEVKIQNYTNKSAVQNVEVSIFDKAGKKVFGETKKITVAPNTIDSVQFEGTIKNVLQWSAETPNLYNMLITLKDGQNKVVEATSHRIGFRKIEIKDGQFFVNGKKIWFKGVNLHEFNANNGNVVDSVSMLRNIQLMKELNINAVRMSHYPQNPIWYRMCDEYGLYLVDEANIESHGMGSEPYPFDKSVHPAFLTEWAPAYADRIKRLVERDKNHASVIMWSMGNECGNGPVFHDSYKWIKNRDKSRPIQFEQAGEDWNTDIVCPMYPSWESMVNISKKDLGRPFIMCEYAHAMGNSMGNFQDYWDLMRSSKNMQGGFIWEWYNHGYKTKDEQNREYWAYGGDLGGYNKLNDGNFCMDGIISPDQQYLPHTHIVKKVYQNILFKAKDLKNGMITVLNDFSFININPANYTFKWNLLKNGEQVATGNFDVTINASAQKDVKINLPKIDNIAGNEYYLQVFAYTKADTKFIPAGFEVAKEEFEFATNNYFAKNNSAIGKVDKKEDGDKVTVSANGISYEFYKNDKGLSNIDSPVKWAFNKLPKLNFWRAPTDNDFGNQAQYNLRLWESASNTQNTIFKNINDKDGAITINYMVKPVGVEAEVALSYTVNTDGSLTINAAYKALNDKLPELMRFGMELELDKRFENFSWYGRGPWENYIDRKDDTFMGIWKGSVKDQAHAYYRPQEAGNKTDVRWLTLTDNEGKGIRISGAQPLSASATNYRTEDWDPGSTKKQQHPSDILPAKAVILNVDLFQRGVAGLDSWQSPPLDQYRFFGKEYKYNYTISFIK